MSESKAYCTQSSHHTANSEKITYSDAYKVYHDKHHKDAIADQHVGKSCTCFSAISIAFKTGREFIYMLDIIVWWSALFIIRNIVHIAFDHLLTFLYLDNRIE